MCLATGQGDRKRRIQTFYRGRKILNVLYDPNSELTPSKRRWAFGSWKKKRKKNLEQEVVGVLDKFGFCFWAFLKTLIDNLRGRAI